MAKQIAPQHVRYTVEESSSALHSFSHLPSPPFYVADNAHTPPHILAYCFSRHTAGMIAGALNRGEPRHG
jgi:hypothetical protein